MSPSIKIVLRRVLRICDLIGFDPRRLTANIAGAAPFVRDLGRYRAKNTHPTFQATFREMLPILYDRRAGAGVIGGHYFHQDVWAAKKVFRRRPAEHLDIGSRIDGFIAHLLVFMPVTLVDIRPMESTVTGIRFLRDDATELAKFADDSVDSVSSLHAAEHFGLGRYSDPVDPDACFRFMNALQRVLAPSGRLYFSVPVGRERVEFNAHRVFAIQTVLKAFSRLSLVSFSLVGDDGLLYENMDPGTTPAGNLCCGLFEFTKPMRSSSSDPGDAA